MDRPEILAILIIIAFFALCLFGGGYLIIRTMTRPDSYIGARLPTEPEEEPDEESGDSGPDDGEPTMKEG